MTTQVKVLIAKIERDTKIGRLEKMFETNDYFQLPIKTLEQEIETLHVTRTVRTLKTHGADFIARLIDASMADQAARSRLTEIALKAFRAEKHLATALDALKNHLIVKYSTDLSLFRTKEERLRIIDLVLERYSRYQEAVNRIQNMVKLIVNDIDQSAWMLKGITESMKMLNRPESTL